MDTGSANQSFLRDFFFELFKDSDNQREHYQLDRELWFSNLDLSRKEERLFELEMYLRAIGCFFNLHNRFLTDRDRVITRDFSAELTVLSAALERGIALSQLLLDRGLASSLNFLSYVESQVAPDYLRLQMLRRTLDQKLPEESLYLLNRCFRDLKKVIDHLLKRPPCTYQLFHHLGQVVTREIAFNRFFNPLLILEFRPEYDRIRSVIILDAIRSIRSATERRAASKVFLALFRLLHYLRYIPRRAKGRVLRRSLILFILFHSEANTLAGYLKILADKTQALCPALIDAVAAVAGDIKQQLHRLFGDELATLDVESSKLFVGREGSAESSREVLEAFLKRCVTRFVQVFRPEVDSGRLFDQARSLREQATRLREDLWLFRQVLDRLIADAEKTKGVGLEVLDPLEKMCDYFLETSYNFLRYGEGSPFERYRAILTEGQHRAGEEVWQTRFVEDSIRFRESVAETYDAVCRRSELVDAPLDLEVLGARLDRWLNAGGE